MITTPDSIVCWLVSILAGISLCIPTTPDPPHIIKVRWAPLTQWQCTTQEKREYIGACAHRKWSERIKENKQ